MFLDRKHSRKEVAETLEAVTELPMLRRDANQLIDGEPGNESRAQAGLMPRYTSAFRGKEDETMGIPITYSPSTIDFGAVAPGYQNYIELRTGTTPAADNVSAQITNQSQPGVFRVSELMVYRWEKRDVSGDLPPDKRHGPVWEWGWDGVSENPGTGPIQVDKGCQLGVSVSVVAPPAAATDTYTGTLQISGSVWEPFTVPLKVVVRQVRTIFQLTSIGVNQGGQVALPILVDSLAGPPTIVSYEMESSLSGVSLQTPAQVPVPQGPTHIPAPGNLTILAADNAGIGTGTLVFWETAFNGLQQDKILQGVTITVHPLPLAPSGIDAKYQQLGGPSGVLGPPTASEQVCGDRHAQFRTYANGIIYWSPELGAHAIYGTIFTYFSKLNLNDFVNPIHSGLGYPTADTVDASFLGGISSGHFQHGGIYSKPTTGTHAVLSPIFDEYVKLGEEGGVLGLPIIDASGIGTSIFGDFENGGLFALPGQTAEQLVAIPNRTAFPPSIVLNQVNQVINDAVQKYNRTANHQLSMQGGPAFQDPQNPVTDYSPVFLNGAYFYTRGRQYKIQQNFFVSGGPFADLTIALTFNLWLSLGGPTQGGTGIDGKNTGPTNQSIVAEVTSASAIVDSHNNPFITDYEVQQAHDQIISIVEGTTVAPIPLPGGPFLSVKVLTTGEGVFGLSGDSFPGVGTVAVFLKPGG